LRCASRCRIGSTISAYSAATCAQLSGDRRPAWDDRGLIAEFPLTTHATITNTGNMPNLQLTDDQVGVLVAYILRLRKRH